MAITQNHVINIQPGVSAPLVIHCSQGDTGTQINLTVVNGDEEFDCSSYVCSVHGTRSDRANWGPVTCNVSGSTVSFSLTSEMTAVAGSCLAEVSIGTVGTANFALLVENATFENGVTYSNDVSVYQNILTAVQAGLSLAEAAVTNEKNERIAAVTNEKNERIAAVNAEATARQNADATLQNNIDAEATARQTADNTLQSNINSEASTRVAADSNLQSQINQIVAPSGEAPSAAEVQNARIGADGVTYDTLGNAIRTQIKNVIVTVTVNNPSDYLYTGRISSSGIVDNSQYDTKFIFKKCSRLKSISYISPYWLTPSAVFFDENYNFLSSYDKAAPSATDKTTIAVPENTAYYAINCANRYTDKISIEETYDRLLHIDDKQNSIAEYSVPDLSTNSLIGGVHADGTIGFGDTDTRYVIRSAVGIKALKIVTAESTTLPVYVFFDKHSNVLSSYVFGNYYANGFVFVLVPSNAEKYASNCLLHGISNWSITEYYSIHTLIEKNAESIESLRVDYPSLLLPKWIPGVVGYPFYIYYENILKTGLLKDYTFSVDNYSQDCKIVTPNSAGDSLIALTLYDKLKLVDSKDVTMRAVSGDTSGSAKILIIGDSKTEAIAPWKTLQNLIDADNNITVTFLGTNKTGGYNREGYSGRNIIDVCDSEKLNQSDNIFYDSTITTPNGHHFNFSKGISALGDTPDIVFIDHGANQIGYSWRDVKGCYDDIIDSIHSINKTIKIVIVVQEAPGLLKRIGYRTNGKFWLNNPIGTSAEKMLTEYSNRDEEYIYIQAQYLCIDMYRDYPICDMPNTEFSVGESEFCMDGIHPGINADAWDSTKTYKYGSWVSRQGNGYGCKRTNTGIDPLTDNGTYWSKCKNLNDGYIKKGYMYYYMIKYLLSL